MRSRRSGDMVAGHKEVRHVHQTRRCRSLRRPRGPEDGGGGGSPSRAGRSARQGSGGRGVVDHAQLRAGTYLPGAPKPPFTPGYELVGLVEELGPGCSRLRVGDRIGALTVWGADADRVCVPESGAVDVPEELDPGEVLSLLFRT